MKRALLLLCPVALVLLLIWQIQSKSVPTLAPNLAQSASVSFAKTDGDAALLPVFAEATSAQSDQATTTLQTPAEATPSPGLTLKAKIHPVYGEPLGELEVRVGLGFVNPEDEIEWMAHPSDHGPADYFDLITIGTWLKASVDTSGNLGPLPVPAAELYRIIAWRADGSIFRGDYIPPNPAHLTGEQDAGHLYRIRPTGIELVFPEQMQRLGWRLSLQRLASDGEQVEKLSPILPMAFPEIQALYDGGSWPLELSTRIAPLYPDETVSLTLRAPDGSLQTPILVALNPEQITRVNLGQQELVFSGKGPLTLNGRILTSAPSLPPGLSLERLGPETEEVVLLPDGSFTCLDMARQQATEFRLKLPEPDPEQGRPLAAPTHYFAFTPSGLERDEAEVVFPVPELSWLELGLSQIQRQRLIQSCSPGYPVFMLQHETDEGWQVRNSAAFLQETQKLAIAVVEPGTYRIVIALSPLWLLTTPAVALAEGESSVQVALPRFKPEPPSVQLIAKRDGAPLARQLLWVSGELGSLPPMRVETDQLGQVNLGPITVPKYHLTAGETERAVDVHDQLGGTVEVGF